MIGIAFTGSGKTVTFSIPLIMLALEEVGPRRYDTMMGYHMCGMFFMVLFCNGAACFL